jgi:hypothetical protein
LAEWQVCDLLGETALELRKLSHLIETDWSILAGKLRIAKGKLDERNDRIITTASIEPALRFCDVDGDIEMSGLRRAECQAVCQHRPHILFDRKYLLSATRKAGEITSCLVVRHPRLNHIGTDRE